MLEGIRQEMGKRAEDMKRLGESFAKTYLNRGYVNFLLYESDAIKEQQVDKRLAEITAKLGAGVVKPRVQIVDIPDDILLFRDQIYEFEKDQTDLNVGQQHNAHTERVSSQP